MFIHKKYANPLAFDNTFKRDKKTIKAIVIHYTSNVGDTAKNNANYFKKINTRYAGSHYFVDKKGKIYQSVKCSRMAYSVGGGKYNSGGKYYGIYTNANTISIELCDCTKKEPYSTKEIKVIKKLIKHIRKHYPNAKKVIRHYDVNGKNCPMPLIKEKEWYKFLKLIGEK